MTAPITGSARIRWGLNHGAGFVIVALAFTTAMAFSTIPTPLYVLYQERDGFPTLMVTVIFAAYAVGVSASLYLVGHVSDWLGRRGVIIAALLVELLSALLFLLWNDTLGLIVARVVSGFGIGALTASATAHLGELHGVARPGTPGRANAVATLANIGGLALGPLIAGILAQFLPLPIVTPFVVFAALLAVAILAVSLVPETVMRPDPLPRYRPQRIAVPPNARSLFAGAGAAAFAAFAVFGLFTSLTPSVMAIVMDEHSRLAAGLVSSAVFAAAALAQLGTGRVGLRSQIWLATGLMLTGSVMLAGSVLEAWLPVFVTSAVIAGSGVGIMFRVAISIAGSLAPPESRGEVLAALFLVAYIGLAVPVLMIGAALIWFPLAAVLLVFCIVIGVLVAAAAPGLARRAAPMG